MLGTSAQVTNVNFRIWKDMSLNDSLSDVERAKLAVWDYPVSDKYTKMWQAMKEARLPHTLEEALERVRNSTSSSEGFAYLGEWTQPLHQNKHVRRSLEPYPANPQKHRRMMHEPNTQISV